MNAKEQNLRPKKECKSTSAKSFAWERKSPKKRVPSSGNNVYNFKVNTKSSLYVTKFILTKFLISKFIRNIFFDIQFFNT